MEGKVAGFAVKRMGEGHHRCDADAAPHQEASSRCRTELEMVDWSRNEDAPAFGENPVHQKRASAPVILAKNSHLIAAAICRIARHRILPHQPGGHQHIDMRPGRPYRQWAAVKRAEFIFCDLVRQMLDLADNSLDHRRFIGRHIGIHIAMKMRCLTGSDPAPVFSGTEQGFKGLDASLTVHRERIGERMRRQRCRIDGHGLILVPEFQISAETATVHRMACRAIGPILGKFDIPPPFLHIVQPAAPGHVIKTGKEFRGLRHVRGSPAERRFGEQPFEVPRAGLHAAPTHRPSLGGDPVGGAFLAVRLPGFIAVEHPLRSSSDGARRTFAGTFLAVLTEVLQTEINRPVMRQWHRRGHHP